MGTFFAALIASSTGLWVAHIAYPIQKQRDRHLKIDEERRAAYADFIGKSEKVVHSLVRASTVRAKEVPKLDADEVQVSGALSILSLYADDSVMVSAGRLEKAVREYGKALAAEKALRPAEIEGEKFKRTEDYKSAIEKRHEAFKALSLARSDVNEKMRHSLLKIERQAVPGSVFFRRISGRLK